MSHPGLSHVTSEIIEESLYCNTLQHSHTHTHTHTLSLSHTHTHTHREVCKNIYFADTVMYSHTLLLSLSHTHTRTHTHTHTHPHTHTHTHAQGNVQKHLHGRHSDIQAAGVSLLQQTQSATLCLPCKCSMYITVSAMQAALSRSFSLTHTHLYTHIHTHIHTHREVCKNICMADTVIYRQHSINAWYFSDSTGKINKKQHTKEFTTRCCSVLRCVAACYGVLQCVAVCCSVLQCVAVW